MQLKVYLERLSENYVRVIKKQGRNNWLLHHLFNVFFNSSQLHKLTQLRVYQVLFAYTINPAEQNYKTRLHPLLRSVRKRKVHIGCVGWIWFASLEYKHWVLISLFVFKFGQHCAIEKEAINNMARVRAIKKVQTKAQKVCFIMPNFLASITFECINKVEGGVLEH